LLKADEPEAEPGLPLVRAGWGVVVTEESPEIRPSNPYPWTIESPFLLYLRNGWTFELGPAPIRVGGVGGCFGPGDFARQSKHLHGYARRRYTRDEIDRLIAQGGLDVLLLHDAPVGVQFTGAAKAT